MLFSEVLELHVFPHKRNLGKKTSIMTFGWNICRNLEENGLSTLNPLLDDEKYDRSFVFQYYSSAVGQREDQTPHFIALSVIFSNIMKSHIS